MLVVSLVPVAVADEKVLGAGVATAAATAVATVVGTTATEAARAIV